MGHKLRIAVTGGTGFIGAALVRALLERGDDVSVLTREFQVQSSIPGCRYFVGDLERGEVPCSFLEGVDILFHCAAEYVRKDRIESINVKGTQMLLEIAEGRVAKWVQLSSVGVYGPQRSGLVSEGTAYRPINSYEISKLEADQLIISHCSKMGIPYSILRPSNVFGVGMKNNSLRALTQLIAKRLFFYIGSKPAMMNYIHVEDVVSALLLCGTRQEANGKVYNLSNDCLLSELVDAVADTSGVDRPKLRVPEYSLRWIVKTIEPFLSLPITTSRIDALTSTAEYSIKKISDELSYRPKRSVPVSIVDFVRGIQ